MKPILLQKTKKKKAKKKKDKKGKKKKAQLAAIDTNTILTDVMLAESDTVLTLFGQSNAVVEYDLTKRTFGVPERRAGQSLRGLPGNY